jgi:hypothetical protein
MKLFNKIKRKLVTLWHKHGKVEKVVEQNSKELEALKLKI